MSSFNSWFFLILQIPSSSCIGPKIFLNIHKSCYGEKTLLRHCLVKLFQTFRKNMPSKRHEPVTQRHCVTFLKTWILNCTPVRPSNFAGLIRLTSNVISISHTPSTVTKWWMD
jgi:hypothetical protein